ncbi:MAG: HEAT repeat domain-containing protein, partial [Bdellovibrionaceae bacterium]|nr:HEAT repeat domain-containing protein [Pseudobdellovibrionaceae bacterium]
LEDLARADDPDIAEQALRSIEAETGDLALDEVLARLDDPYPEIREEAARALGRIGSPLAVDTLATALRDPSSSLPTDLPMAIEASCSSSGVRKIPPPTPTKPEARPMPAPAASWAVRDTGRRRDSSGAGRKNRIAAQPARGRGAS